MNRLHKPHQKKNTTTFSKGNKHEKAGRKEEEVKAQNGSGKWYG